ncbi:MAG TPA: hypothetical protein VMT46_15710 [Anaerolineaceae bacterium]|nr:hypothetical protein [Anaerolineaceae bacterium]
MKKTSTITQVLIGLSLLAAIAVFQGCALVPQANQNTSRTVEKGDVHLVEGQQSIQRARAADLARWVAMGQYYSKAAGMGDVHLAENLSIPVTGFENSILPDNYMGEWKRFEVQQEEAARQDTADQASGHTYFGTGDPLRFRARPVPTPRPVSTPISDGQTNPGMGDLHLFDDGKGR